MFNKWRGTAHSIANSAWNRFRIFWLPLSVGKKLTYLGATAVLAVGVVVVISQLVSGPKLGKPLPTPEQAMKTNLDNLISSPPKPKASVVERATYYNRLAVAQADDKNYAAAAAALQKRADAYPAGMAYYDYIQMAVYYHQAKNDAAALKSLDMAAKAMPSQDDDKTGYNHDLVQKRIDTLRQEYGA